MTLNLNLTSEEETRLREVAAQHGVAPQEYILKVVKDLLQSGETTQRIAALRSLLDDDEEEQRETGEYLLRVLDEDRLSSRKLFP
jgi:hypothetical protein